MQFHPIYTPTIMSGPVIRWEGGYNRSTYRDIISGEERIEWSGEISASRDGVMIQGAWPALSDPQDVEDFCACLRKAHAAHESIVSDNRLGGGHDIAKAIVAREVTTKQMASED